MFGINQKSVNRRRNTQKIEEPRYAVRIAQKEMPINRKRKKSHKLKHKILCLCALALAANLVPYFQDELGMASKKAQGALTSLTNRAPNPQEKPALVQRLASVQKEQNVAKTEIKTDAKTSPQKGISKTLAQKQSKNMVEIDGQKYSMDNFETAVVASKDKEFLKPVMEEINRQLASGVNERYYYPQKDSELIAFKKGQKSEKPQKHFMMHVKVSEKSK